MASKTMASTNSATKNPDLLRLNNQSVSGKFVDFFRPNMAGIGLFRGEKSTRS